MSDTVSEVENLRKKYIIGHQKQERYRLLRDVIADEAKAALLIWDMNCFPYNF